MITTGTFLPKSVSEELLGVKVFSGRPSAFAFRLLRVPAWRASMRRSFAGFALGVRLTTVSVRESLTVVLPVTVPSSGVSRTGSPTRLARCEDLALTGSSPGFETLNVTSPSATVLKYATPSASVNRLPMPSTSTVASAIGSPAGVST